MAKVYVLSGAPCTGKTTIIQKLKNKGYKTLEEGAAKIGKKAKETEKKFDDLLFEFRKNQLEKIRHKQEIFFSDRSIIDGIAFSKIKNHKVPDKILNYLEKTKYSKVFIMEPLGFYESNENRQFPKEKQNPIHKTLIKTYQTFGYDPILVPAKSAKERTDFILSLTANKQPKPLKPLLHKNLHDKNKNRLGKNFTKRIRKKDYRISKTRPDS